MIQACTIPSLCGGCLLTVPGLGLRHYRFGFSSSWLALTALFDQGSLSYRMLNSVTGFAIVLLLAQFAFALTRKGERKDRGPDLYLITAIPALLLFAGGLVLVQAASPNFGVGAAFVLTGWLLVTGASALSLLLGGGALAVKINAAIILPFVCTRVKRTIWIGTILLALPLALANSRTTGCLAYPAPLFCSNTPSSISPAETRQVSYEAVDQGRRGDSLTAWAGRWAVGLNRYALYYSRYHWRC